MVFHWGKYSYMQMRQHESILQIQMLQSIVLRLMRNIPTHFHQVTVTYSLQKRKGTHSSEILQVMLLMKDCSDHLGLITSEHFSIFHESDGSEIIEVFSHLLHEIQSEKQPDGTIPLLWSISEIQWLMLISLIPPRVSQHLQKQNLNESTKL